MKVVQEWNRLGGEPQLLEVQSMLGTALQNSSCDGDDFADRLYVIQSGYDGYHSGLLNPLSAVSKHQHALDTFVDCNSKLYVAFFSNLECFHSQFILLTR